MSPLFRRDSYLEIKTMLSKLVHVQDFPVSALAIVKERNSCLVTNDNISMLLGFKVLLQCRYLYAVLAENSQYHFTFSWYGMSRTQTHNLVNPSHILLTLGLGNGYSARWQHHFVTLDDQYGDYLWYSCISEPPNKDVRKRIMVHISLFISQTGKLEADFV